MNEIKGIEDYLKGFKEDLENFRNTKVKCAIIGRSGTGKSSLINAILGYEAAKVGEIETTMDPSKPFEHNGLQFFDLPGSSTLKFPKETYIETLNIKSYDCVILVTSERFYEDDLYLTQEMLKIGISVFTVRTKIDFAVDRGLKRGVLEEQTLCDIKKDLKKNLKGIDVEIYLTSADYPQKYELNDLLLDISKSLTKIKRDRFIADVTITSMKVIAEKRKIAEKVVAKSAALSAANGLNPIPGADVAVDVGVLVKMAYDISNIYGLSKENINFYDTITTSQKAKGVLAKITQYIAKYAGKEAIMILLKRFATSALSKSVSKWIPFVGPVIAAGIGYKMTSSLGEDMLTDAEQIAVELFESLK